MSFKVTGDSPYPGGTTWRDVEAHMADEVRCWECDVTLSPEELNDLEGWGEDAPLPECRACAGLVDCHLCELPVTSQELEESRDLKVEPSHQACRDAERDADPKGGG